MLSFSKIRTVKKKIFVATLLIAVSLPTFGQEDFHFGRLEVTEADEHPIESGRHVVIDIDRDSVPDVMTNDFAMLKKAWLEGLPARLIEPDELDKPFSFPEGSDNWYYRRRGEVISLPSF